MTAPLSIAQAIGRLAEMTVAVKAAELRVMEKAARIVETEAKAEIGKYQDEAGPFVAWEQLSPRTLWGGYDQDTGFRYEGKIPLGYATEENHNPLLRTGDMRDSIGHAVGFDGLGGAEAVVGSNSDIAVYQELGTSKMPPRSFLGGAAFRKGEEVARAVGSDVVKALVGEEVVNGSLSIP